MKIYKNKSLKNLNTFGVEARAKVLVELESDSDIEAFIKDLTFKNEKKVILGKGSNVLITEDINGIVIILNNKGIQKIKEDNKYVYMEIAAGEVWHDLVTYAARNNLGGIENMALIPGTVGAAAVQNIAAYGQNLIDVFVNLEAINLLTSEKKVFTKENCKFSYRESIFKSELRNKFLVTKISIKLCKDPIINNEYFETGKTYKTGLSLHSVLSEIAEPPFTVKDVYNAVIKIRKQKLPNPDEIGTAGSFFKNPVVKRSVYETIKKTDPNLQCYPVDKLSYRDIDDPLLTRSDYVKIPAGRLLDNLGWKGKRIGNVGTYPYQALAVVNYGGATAEEIYVFTQAMKKDVQDKYGVTLEREIQLIGN